MLEKLEHLNLWYILVVLLVIFSSYFLRAVRWKFLLPKDQSPDNKTLYHATSAGMLAIWIVPLRAGELFRPWAISRDGKIPFSTSLASILLERIFDVLAVLTLLAICLPQLPEIPAIVEKGAMALGLIAGAIGIFICLCFVAEKQINQLFQSILNFIFSKQESFREKISSIFGDFLSGLKSIGSFSRILAVLGLTAIIWFHFILIYQLSIWAIGIEAGISLGALVTVIVALAIAAPSAPGFVGTFQFGCVLALSTIYGMEKETSVAYSFLVHFVQVFAGVVLGVASLKQLGLNFKSLAGSKN